MADEQPTKKRRVRKVETIRQQTEKVRQGSENPKRVKSRKLLGKIFSPLAFLAKPLRWLGRHIIPRYFRNAFTELRQVTWPDRKQSRQLTTAVILFAIIFAFFVSVLDYVLDKIFKKVFLHE